MTCEVWNYAKGFSGADSVIILKGFGWELAVGTFLCNYSGLKMIDHTWHTATHGQEGTQYSLNYKGGRIVIF